MRFELMLGTRYLKRKKRKGIISFNFFLSAFIVMLGVFILIVVISVMNGFQTQIKETLLQADSHILIRHRPYQNRVKPMENYAQIAEIIRKNDSVISAIPHIRGDGLLRKDGYLKPVQVRGIPVDQDKKPPEDIRHIMTDYFGHKLTNENRKIIPEGNSILVGHELKNEFNLDYGSKIELILPKGDLSARVGLTPVIRVFTVQGFFKSGYYAYDSSLVYLSMAVSSKVFGVGDAAFGIAVKINDIFQSNFIRDQIIDSIGPDYRGYTIEELNKNLFTALQLEKGVMSILLFLIIIAAAFNITGTLIWLVMDKRKDIGILKSMGATSRSILTIFLFQGFFIGLMGTLFGTVFGMITAQRMEKIINFSERSINFVMGNIYHYLDIFWQDITIIPPIYYVEGFPSHVDPVFIAWIIAVTISITTLAGLVPAWQAAKLQPVETMRYE